MLPFILAAALAVNVPAMPPVEVPVAAYEQGNGNADAGIFHGTVMWRAFHGESGVARIVDATIDRSMVDNRISDIFKGQDMVRLRRLLREQFCYILNGGCAYTGRTMADAHKNMGIQMADMAAIVENLQAAMRAEHVHFHDQNRLLAKLAPMKYDIIEHKRRRSQ